MENQCFSSPHPRKNNISRKSKGLQETENNHDFAECGEAVAQEGLPFLGEELWAVCQQTAGASHVPEEAWVGAEGKMKK